MIQRSCPGIPDPYLAVTAPACQGGSIRRKGDRGEVVGAAAYRPLFPRMGVPGANGVVPAAGSQKGAIRGVGQGADKTLMSYQFLTFLVGLGIPYFQVRIAP